MSVRVELMLNFNLLIVCMDLSYFVVNVNKVWEARSMVGQIGRKPPAIKNKIFNQVKSRSYYSSELTTSG